MRREDRAVNLFVSLEEAQGRSENLGPGARVLRGFAASRGCALLADLRDVIAESPFRQMVTPGGFRMSVAMTNCGSFGWVTDKTGYRYSATDPATGRHWPDMPALFLQLAEEAAANAGFSTFAPDACLISRYEPGARLSLHQDKNERDFLQPVVSISLGVPAVFLFGGTTRADKTIRVPLEHGDVVIWGGPARLRYHGVASLKVGHHAVLGNHRINLSFRKASS